MVTEPAYCDYAIYIPKAPQRHNESLDSFKVDNGNDDPYSDRFGGLLRSILLRANDCERRILVASSKSSTNIRN